MICRWRISISGVATEQTNNFSFVSSPHLTFGQSATLCTLLHKDVDIGHHNPFVYSHPRRLAFGSGFRNQDGKFIVILPLKILYWIIVCVIVVLFQHICTGMIDLWNKTFLAEILYFLCWKKLSKFLSVEKKLQISCLRFVWWFVYEDMFDCLNSETSSDQNFFQIVLEQGGMHTKWKCYCCW